MRDLVKSAFGRFSGRFALLGPSFRGGPEPLGIATCADAQKINLRCREDPVTSYKRLVNDGKCVAIGEALNGRLSPWARSVNRLYRLRLSWLLCLPFCHSCPLDFATGA